MKQRIIMFDFDGVIADSFDVFYAALVRALREYGYGCVRNPAEFRGLFDSNFYKALQDKKISECDLGDLLADVGRKVQARMGDMHVFEGIPAAIRALSAACPLYIITSNQSDAVDAFLRRVGLRECFREILGVDVNPSKVEKIRGVRRRHPRQSFVYVGDTVGDLREARRARVGQAAAAWGWHDHDRLRREVPDYFLESPAELLRLRLEA